MKKLWNEELKRILILVLVSSTIGWVIGQIAWTLAIVLAFYATKQFLQLRRLILWIDRPSTEMPELSGIWEEMAYRFYRTRRRSESRKTRIANLLKRYQQATQSIPDATILLNSREEIEWFNGSATRILNLNKKDIGQPIGRLIRDPQFVAFLGSAEIDSEPLDILSPVDDSKFLEIRLVPSALDQRMLLIRDNTHIHRLTEMRRDFVANVSHELRTPLTVVIGYLETIETLDDLTVEELHDLVGRMSSPAHRMKTLVEDLLQLSKLDTGVIPAASQCPGIEVSALLKSIVRDADQLSSGSHQIETNIESGLRLRGMEKEIYSVFSNLVNNAVRYTPDDGLIQVVWKSVPEGALFQVVDSGVGIARENIDRLTERFYRVDVGRSRDSGGTGLGLSIVKQVLRRHDAELSIKSEIGKGSTFSCLFFAERVEGPEAIPSLENDLPLTNPG
ncbi:MAG: phosphate regulon sensor histidine kinase PhoR [Pseudomonadales bacterium]|nr:phosphate regulon sensor histidine kinase PhoR [Pseudomonadales bacterium]